MSRGSPAHAGIDPGHCGKADKGVGLPRACGDRPQGRIRLCVFGQAPPRMRGSTLTLLRSRWRERGSPAHAGIDPRLMPNAAIVFGLPRACGDRPLGRVGEAYDAGAPPRMRGSTQVAHRFCGMHRGSPAHAGIDPDRKVTCEVCRGLPRACGDRPIRPRASYTLQGAPPRMRGSTLRHLGLSSYSPGSPAHAGIDP